MTTKRSSPSRKRLFQLAILMGCVLGLLFWKVDYVYEVALFSQLAHATPTTPKDSEAALFDLTTHQISRNLYIKNEKSPLVFLLNGFALCDQQAKVLARLLYFKQIPSRAVPLYFDSGVSNHTIFEWFDGQKWVFSDPFLHLPINIPALEFCVLETRSAQTEVQKQLIRRAHQYYAINQGLLEELKATYARPQHAVWDFFRSKPEMRLLETLIASPLKIWPANYLAVLNTAYRFRHYRDQPLMNRYIKARHQELMGQCTEALAGYRALLPLVKGGGRPRDLHFELDLEMLKWRIVANRSHCRSDHPIGSSTRG